MASAIFQHSLANGMTVLAERMDHVRSAAFSFLVPAGCVYDPPKFAGIGSLMSELITRGAGPRNNRELTLALDNLGLDRSASVGSMHMRFGGATLARNLPAVLDLSADILRRPHLPDDELEPVQQLALQDLQAIEDEPRQKLLLELRRRHYPTPLSNDQHGTVEGITAVTSDDIRKHYEKYVQPKGTILAIAGNIDWEPLKAQVEKLFGDWKPGQEETLKFGPKPTQREHLAKDTTQTQIGIAYPSVPIGDKDYYKAMGAVNVLSGGMSSRLFTHVREERGLCYAVWASYSSFKDRGSVLAYAGTTTERAQETLDVMIRELKRLADGIETDELARVKAGLKSSLIMQQESTTSRAGSLAADWYYLGRVRSIEEIQAAIDGLTPEGIVAHLKQYPAQDFTIVTLGQKELVTPGV